MEPETHAQAEVVCRVPPPGWYCTRAPGHDGPCAAIADESLGPIVYEQAYDRGFDDGWKLRDDMTRQSVEEATRRAYDNGWLAGVQATLGRHAHSPLASD